MKNRRLTYPIHRCYFQGTKCSDITDPRKGMSGMEKARKKPFPSFLKHSRSWYREYFRANWQLYLLMGLVMAFFIVFKYRPMYGLRMAFMDFNPFRGFEGSKWVGLKHFQRLFTTRQFFPALKNTLVLSVYSLVVGMPFPILFALLLNSLTQEKLKKGIQTITYAPHFISTVVIVGMLKLFLSPSYGIVNYALQKLTGSTINFFGVSTMFPHMYVWSDIWQNTGWNAVIYIAALCSADPALHEAAMVDGCGRFKRLWYIDLPCIIPTFVILLIMRFGSLVNIGFEKVFLMQTDLNLSTSETLATYAYKLGLQKTEYSFSAAVDLFNSVVTFVLLMVVNSISRKLTETSLW